MATLETTLELKAAADRTWLLLNDLSLYSRWNPLIREVRGTPVIGSRLEISLELPDIPPFTLNPTVLAFGEETGIVWRQELRVPGILTWEQSFRVEPLEEERHRFRHRIRFGGLVGPFYVLVMRRFLLAGMERLNESLKKYVEKEIRCFKC